jgi:ADP-heptose:LPS heptosyltransferase
MEHPDQILLIRLSSIGDILLTFPLIQTLHREYSDTAIDFIIFKHHENVLRPIRSWLRNVITYDKSATRTENHRIRKIIQKKHYPLIIDLHNSPRSRRLTFDQQRSCYRFKKQHIRRFFYIKFGWQIYPEIPVWRKYIQTVPLEFKDPAFHPLEFQPEPEIVKRLMEDYPVLKSDRRKILIYPGARHFTKCWSLDYYETLIKMILVKTDWQILLGGSIEESDYIAPLTAIDKTRVSDISGKYDLSENFILIYLSDLIISNDSAPMHMASLLGKKQLAIFGNTVRQFGFYPSNPNAVIIEDNSVKCRPCSHIGFEQCPKKHFDCIRKITPEMVFRKIEDVSFE